MRIHSDVLTGTDLFDAARVADMSFETYGEGGSRSRKKAFNVLCSGNSTRNAMSNEFKAATWDQWGVLLGILFDKDPNMHTGKNGYADRSDFHYKTDFRFQGDRSGIDVKSSHSHRWTFTGVARVNACKSDDCSAVVRW